MLSILSSIISKQKNKIKEIIFKIKWRRLNKHNFTTAVNIFPINKVRVGKMTYGPLNIYSWDNEDEGIIIGNFVSIASGVKFLLGGNHRTDTVSTYPFKVKILGEKTEATTKGKIIIEDDVWIGMDAMILSGVTIGKGAVVAARSVITRDVPPYSIVAGNPAKVIRYRFDKNLIKKLEDIDMEKLDAKFIKENIDYLYKTLDENIYKELFEKLRR